MGVVENVVTKIGGNNFTYDGILTLTFPFMSAQNSIPTPQPAYVGTYTNNNSPGPATSFYSPIVNVGGPIIPDRLWFYASAQVNFSDRQTPISTFYHPLSEN